MKTIEKVIVFTTFPFLIAAAFKFTDWLGWPTLIVLGVYWVGTIVLIGKE